MSEEYIPALGKRNPGGKWFTRIFWLLLLGGLLLWAVYSAPLSEIWATLKLLKLWQIAVLIVVNALVMALITARWWFIVHAEKSSLPFLPLIGFRLAAFGMSYFTPGPQVGGEPLQVLYLQRSYGLTFARATASVIMDKLIELLGNVIFLAIGLVVISSFGFLSLSEMQVTGTAIPVAAILLWPPIHIALLYRGRHPLSFLARAAQSRLPERKGLKKAIRLLIVAEHLAGTFIHRHFGAVMASLGVSLLASMGSWPNTG